MLMVKKNSAEEKQSRTVKMQFNIVQNVILRSLTYKIHTSKTKLQFRNPTWSTELELLFFSVA